MRPLQPSCVRVPKGRKTGGGSRAAETNADTSSTRRGASRAAGQGTSRRPLRYLGGVNRSDYGHGIRLEDITTPVYSPGCAALLTTRCVTVKPALL